MGGVRRSWSRRGVASAVILQALGVGVGAWLFVDHQTRAVAVLRAEQAKLERQKAEMARLQATLEAAEAKEARIRAALKAARDEAERARLEAELRRRRGLKYDRLDWRHLQDRVHPAHPGEPPDIPARTPDGRQPPGTDLPPTQ